jgi:glycosyltransferase involved in cell wall biosynthesis
MHGVELVLVPNTKSATDRLSVSVVIPTYNRLPELRRSLASVMAQTTLPTEIVVCDDARDPVVEAAVSAIATTALPIRYITPQDGCRGAGAARNAALRVVRGEWTAFLDDDDEWIATKLETQYSFVRDFDVIASNAFKRSGATYWPADGLRTINRFDLARSNEIIMSSVLIRTSLLRNVEGFVEDAALQGVADYDLWLRIAREPIRIIRVGTPLVWYEDRGDARLSSDTIKQLRSTCRIALNLWRQHPTDLATAQCALVHSRALVMANVRSAGMFGRGRGLGNAN